jgi:glutathione S-transferase
MPTPRTPRVPGESSPDRIGAVILYDAPRCPYCARVRIVLAEKGVSYEAVEIDLDDRPAWIYTKNPLGKVPVLEEDGGLVLPESVVIMEYLEERYPEPELWPADPAERALGRLLVEQFDARLGKAYYALRRGRPGAREALARNLEGLDALLEERPYLTGREYGLADAAYVPWIQRAQARLDVELNPYPALAAWSTRLAERASIAAELELAAVR